jgi:hypothetical protein
MLLCSRTNARKGTEVCTKGYVRILLLPDPLTFNVLLRGTQIPVATKFCTVAPNTRGFSIWNCLMPPF